ncbi:MAG: DUF190 domain-containing protein [Deltaproteobacteria bacterium]|nr:DUF190 domain-containing protein [Deltaproteobacteria bacterium]
MKLQGENVMLRIFVDTFQKWHHRPIYEAIVERAHAEHLAGATVLAALEGFGQNGHLLKQSPWRLSGDREVIVEVVDTPEKIDGFLAGIEPLLENAVVTLERAHVVFYRPGKEKP